MIGEAELRRHAALWKVDPMLVDLDYSLGWFVAALYGANEGAERLLFKGGTCLRKCYFGDYRAPRLVVDARADRVHQCGFPDTIQVDRVT